jgi:hypothetical protein
MLRYMVDKREAVAKRESVLWARSRSMLFTVSVHILAKKKEDVISESTRAVSDVQLFRC